MSDILHDTKAWHSSSIWVLLVQHVFRLIPLTVYPEYSTPPVYFTFDDGNEPHMEYHDLYVSATGHKGQALNLTGTNDYATIG